MAAASATLTATVVLACPATADPAPSLQGAVEQVRGSSTCGQLEYDPVVEEAAEIVNRSSDVYLNHTARHVPVADPLPIIHDLGVAGGKAISLYGAAPNTGDSIRSVLLQGYQAIPDCAYTKFGVSMLWNESTGKNLATVVLVGP
ncbi:hypothetical protein BST36_02200 [Mycolicibacterium moriokaense]|nr:hypothetical protein [Mycolicibacterium moriokaense]ORB26952.1 hypothetical protein BST36_02200 [Mycolicibacterium moriokaense]